MKKALSVVLALVFVLALAACGATSSSTPAAGSSAAPAASGGSAAASQPASTGGSGEKLKVAMLLPGPINDKGWNAKAYQGLMLIQEKLGAEVTYSENVEASDYEELFRGYGDMGYDMIIGHGFQFADAAKAVAVDYPDSFFAITSADVNQAPNLAGLQNRNDELGFLAGAVAALESKSGVVGCVGGQEMPPIVAYVEGFKAGAEHINPDIKVLSNYTGNNNDAAAAKQMAQAMIGEGADVLSHDANAAGLGVFEAVDEAPEGTMIVGCIDDQYELSPERTITSSLNSMSEAILRAATFLQEGTLEAKTYSFGVADDIITLADYRDYPISDENKAKMDEIIAQIKSGDLTVDILDKLA